MQLNYNLLPHVSEVIKELHNKGIEFVLCTARYGWYFLPAVIFIKKNRLPIKIFYGKPSADIYIDNKNFHILVNDGMINLSSIKKFL